MNVKLSTGQRMARYVYFPVYRRSLVWIYASQYALSPDPTDMHLWRRFTHDDCYMVNLQSGWVMTS